MKTQISLYFWNLKRKDLQFNILTQIVIKIYIFMERFYFLHLFINELLKTVFYLFQFNF